MPIVNERKTSETPLRVADIMSRDVASCAPDDTLNRAAQLMWDRDCGVIPVVEDGHLLGMITDRDCCMASYTTGRRLTEIPVREAMSRGAHTCSPDDSLADAETRMRRFQVRRLPVLEDGRLVGIVSLNDLALAAQRGLGSSDDIASTLATVCRHRPSSHPEAAA